MAMQDEVALSGSQVEGIVDDPQVIFNLAEQEVTQCLRVPDDSFDKICRDIETASSRAMLRLALQWHHADSSEVGFTRQV